MVKVNLPGVGSLLRRNRPATMPTAMKISESTGLAYLEHPPIVGKGIEKLGLQQFIFWQSKKIVISLSDNSNKTKTGPISHTYGSEPYFYVCIEGYNGGQSPNPDCDTNITRIEFPSDSVAAVRMQEAERKRTVAAHEAEVRAALAESRPTELNIGDSHGLSQDR